MKVIGLTGPTGAGKTVVAQLWGLPTVNADKVARTLHKDPQVLAELQNRFGEDVVTDGVLNRMVLAKKAFSSHENTAALNGIMHLRILEEIARQLRVLEQEGNDLCVLDAPLLFEGNCVDLCHVTVAVLAKDEVRMERIIQRDGISMDMALKRMSAQQRDEYYISQCDHTLYNSGDITQLHQMAAALLDEIKKNFSLGGF
jgi:dephospho-CoA kinase